MPALARPAVVIPAGVLFGLILIAAPARGAARSSAALAPASPALLDVPYQAQTEDLCGGAALAMVFAYWGNDKVFAQDFAGLVDRSAAGIRTSALAQAVSDRGWQAHLVPALPDASLASIAGEIARGRPLIALIEARPSVYHYVVIVGLTPDAIVVHDPAAAPFRTIARDEFARRWGAAGRWLLLVLPPTDPPVATAPATLPRATAPADTSADEAPAAASPCDGLVAAGMALAKSGQDADADRSLTTATEVCPSTAAGWRELAGLRFSERRYADASHLGAHAVALDAADAYTWRLVATSRYLFGDLTGALDAWNHGGAPLVAGVQVTGLRRTRQPVVVRRAAIESRAILTAGAFARANRRLADLPSADHAAVRYDPIGGGENATVQLTAEEPTVLPRTIFDIGAAAFHTLVETEVTLDVVSPAHDGDVWTGAYRWAANRPRVGGGLVVPAPRPLPGLFSLDASWERQSYAPTSAGGLPIVQDQRHASGGLSDWATGWLRWRFGGGADRFDTRDYAALSGALDVGSHSGHVKLALAGAHWMSRATDGFSTARAVATWRSAIDETSPGWTADAGVSVATDAAPLAAWPVASSNDARGELLRAHTLFEHGVIVNPLLGRRLAFASGTYQRPVWRRPFASVAAEGFMDLARSWSRRDPGATPIEVDVGAGLRVNAIGSHGTVRLDWAYGLRDGTRKWSTGYVETW